MRATNLSIYVGIQLHVCIRICACNGVDRGGGLRLYLRLHL